MMVVARFFVEGMELVKSILNPIESANLFINANSTIAQMFLKFINLLANNFESYLGYDSITRTA